MNLLILHQNFPGQFRHIARHMADAGHDVLGIGAKHAPGLKGVRLVRYEIKNAPKPSHQYLATACKGALHGEVVAKALLELKKQHYAPDVILAHPGWGEALYVKDVFPDTRLVSLFEFYYHARGVDVGFEPGSEASFDLAATLASRNLLHLMNLERCDAGVSPTSWQRSLHPKAYLHKISVAHEGIDTAFMAPNPKAVFQLPDGRTLKSGDKVLTFVARHLEPYRGFHVFMRALPEIQRRNPEAVTVIVGGDSVSYGRKPEGAANWRVKLLAEVGANLDLSRVVFTGQLPYAAYRSLLQVSAAHAYLTYPFVLSWSALEAMSCGCLLVASATPPVTEVMGQGRNALLFDFFNLEALAKRVTDALSHPEDYVSLRATARKTVVEGYDIERGISQYMALLKASQQE
ncbi:MAG: glycosyltransferase family 4 protein [Humidesulfovibrio sp.]|uniref:glycosyltransferase family 4 protein n=1 Tax=Humidesulfovibrio sp. TaxID=2910988 RepID=UPI0027376300|nr:glycosyltransferase family 4 protein [Humidesulfovibrio sp.]MDP2848511.1 glycosyltransferase family 4 protein [Humidesulfovibrio sp.]